METWPPMGRGGEAPKPRAGGLPMTAGGGQAKVYPSHRQFPSRELLETAKRDPFLVRFPARPRAGGVPAPRARLARRPGPARAGSGRPGPGRGRQRAAGG